MAFWIMKYVSPPEWVSEFKAENTQVFSVFLTLGIFRNFLHGNSTNLREVDSKINQIKT